MHMADFNKREGGNASFQKKSCKATGEMTSFLKGMRKKFVKTPKLEEFFYFFSLALEIAKEMCYIL